MPIWISDTVGLLAYTYLKLLGSRIKCQLHILRYRLDNKYKTCSLFKRQLAFDMG
jgi:hypothetical protein